MIKVNLLPLDLQEKAKERFSVFWFGLFPVLVILVCVPFYIIKLKQIREVQQEIVTVDTEIAKYKDVEDKLAAAKQENQLLDTKINFITSKKKMQGFWLNALDRISAILPPDIWLSSISLTPEGLATVGGNTFSFKSLANFIRLLQRTSFLSDVKMSSSSKSYGSAGTGDRVTFQLSFTYKEEQKEEAQSETKTQ